MAIKTVSFTKAGIAQLPADMPALYRIKTAAGNDNYVGVAKRGRIRDRLLEHLETGPEPVPGTKVQIEQMTSIGEARSKEERVMRRGQPRYNERGK